MIQMIVVRSVNVIELQDFGREAIFRPDGKMLNRLFVESTNRIPV